MKKIIILLVLTSIGFNLHAQDEIMRCLRVKDSPWGVKGDPDNPYENNAYAYVKVPMSIESSLIYGDLFLIVTKNRIMVDKKGVFVININKKEYQLDSKKITELWYKH